LIELISVTLVGMVGNEGIAGISVFLGIDTTSIKAIVQIPGDAMRMRTSDFKQSFWMVRFIIYCNATPRR